MKKGRKMHSKAFVPYCLDLLKAKREGTIHPDGEAFLRRNQDKISLALSRNLKKWASPAGTTP